MRDDQAAVPDWKGHVRRAMTTHDQAIGHVRPDDSVFTILGHNVETLMAMIIGSDTPVRYTPTVGPDLSWLTPETAERIRVNTYFGTPPSRDAINSHLVEITPWWFQGGHKAFQDQRPGARPIDVAMVRVTPPNEAGWCCLGNSIWDAKFLALNARTTIAVISEDVPRTYGDSWIRVTDLDVLVEEDPEPPLWDLAAASMERAREQAAQPVPQAIAKHVASLIRDGDAIQVGTGTMTAALVLGGALDEKNDLSYFAELTVPGVIGLAERGIITGKYLATHPGKFVTTMAGVGYPEETEIVTDNPDYEFYGFEYMHDPRAIAANDNLVAINNALSVDLTGQIAAGQIVTRNWSGTGGQLSYQIGAFLSKGGRAVTVLPSTAKGGTVSRIVSAMPAGQVITVPRDLADIVVTEHGIAHLLNKTERERAHALIEIADPAFRDELRAEARRLYGG